MENHPIPQDITGFQFKLIGDMTIKQFAYLAFGLILGWITLILPVFILIKLPFVLIFVGLGVATAFVPIEGRPFDIMIINYFKALFGSTQYVYQKVGGHMWFPELKKQPVQTPGLPQASPDSTRELKDYLKSLPQKPKNKLDEKELSFLNSLSSLSSAGQKSQDQQSTNVYQQIAGTQIQPVNHPAQQLASYQQQLEKMQVQQEISAKTESQKEDQVTVSVPVIIQSKIQAQTVRKIPQEPGKSLGLPLVAEFPNLVAGVIKNPRSNPLPNILVEVKDEAGNPVRAFKTNVLGQFISSTPLANGVYTISFEDPKEENKFDTIELSVTGGILTPIEIISLDTREELRRSLFNPVMKKT